MIIPNVVYAYLLGFCFLGVCVKDDFGVWTRRLCGTGLLYLENMCCCVGVLFILGVDD